MRLAKQVKQFLRKIEIPASRQPVLMLGIGALFYAYQYAIRILPGVLIDDILADHAMSVADFSSLGSAYLYSYAAFQIPMAMLLCKFGIKRTFICSIIVCIIGSLLFTFGGSLRILKLARVIQGAASSCVFVGMLQLIVKIGDDDHTHPLLNGALMAVGAAGAAICGVSVIGWMSSFGLSGLVIIASIVMFLCALLLLKFDDDSLAGSSIRQIVDDLRGATLDRNIVIYALFSAALYAPVAVFADLWCTGTLMVRYELSRGMAIQNTNALYFGLCCGSVVLSSLLHNHAAKYLKYLILIATCVFAITLGYADEDTVQSLLFLTGFFSGSSILCFALVINKFDGAQMYIRSGILNAFSMVFCGIMQQMSGAILSVKASGATGMTLSQYNYGDFTSAFSIIVLTSVICCMIAFFLKK